MKDPNVEVQVGQHMDCHNRFKSKAAWRELEEKIEHARVKLEALKHIITLLLATSACSEIRTRINYLCVNRKNSVISRIRGGYDVQLQHSLNDYSCEIAGEEGESISPVPRSLSEDPLVGLFNVDDVHEKKELLDFLYDKAVLSANKYDKQYIFKETWNETWKSTWKKRHENVMMRFINKWLRMEKFLPCDSRR